MKGSVYMDFDQLRKAISRSTRSGGSTGSANKSNQVIQNWTNNQSSNIAQQQQTQQQQQGDTVTSIDAALKRLDVQNERQKSDLKNVTEANDIQKLAKSSKDFGDQIANITGFNEAYAKAKDETTVGNVLDAMGKFVTGLPGQMAGGLIGAPSKFYEAATGENVQEMQHDSHTGKDYISTQKLDAEQRAATAGDAVIDVIGIPFGGSGKLVGSLGRVAADAAGKDITKGAGKLAVDVAKGAAEEAGEEFTQAWLENVRGTEKEHGVENAIKNSDKIMGEALENAALGAAGGGIMGAGGHAIDALRSNRDTNSSKAQSSASIGNPAPTTPRHDYHEQGTTDSTGHLTQTAQQAIKEQAERGGTTDRIPGVQSATNLTIVEDNTKGQNDFGMGFDDLVAAMHNEIEHEYWKGNPNQTSADVYAEALGGRDEVEAAIKQWDSKQTSDATKIGSFDNLFAKYSASANSNARGGNSNLESHQIAKQAYDGPRIAFMNAYIKGDPNIGISEHAPQFAVGKNPANEHQMRTMWLTGISDGTGYHMNSANHKAFNSDTDGDRLFASTRKAFYGDKGGAYGWQRYADETETPINILDGGGNVRTVNAHLKDRLGMTDRANSIKSETAKDGSLPEWGKEGEATNKLVYNIKQFCANHNITNKKSIKRLTNAARTFARFNAFDSDNYGTSEQGSMFKHDFDKHGELCTTAAQLQAMMLEEVQKANPGLFKLTDNVATRQDAVVANEAAAILDRGDDSAYVDQMLAENDTAIRSSLQEIQSYIDEVAPVKVDGVMDENSFGEHKGKISSSLEAAFGKMAKLFSLHISYANSHSPQLFRDSQALLYEVKGALSNNGISDGQFSNVMEIYLSRLMHINQLTESNTDLVKTIISDLVWANMKTKYPEGIPADSKKLNQFLLDFARSYDEGVAMIDAAYKKANPTPNNWGTEKEGKDKDYSKIIPRRIFKEKPNEKVDYFEFKGSEKEALLSAVTRTYGQNAINKIFQYEGPYKDITISSLVSARMSDPTYANGDITGDTVIDGFINDLLKNEIEARKREARSVTNDIESVLAIQRRIVGRIDDSKGRVHAEDVPAYTNLLDFISQLLGARNAVSMGIVDVYAVLSEKNKDVHKYVQALLRSTSKEEFLSRLMGAKLFADFDKIQYLHNLLNDNQYADSRDNIIRSILVEADKVGNYSPLHRVIVNYMFQYKDDSTLPEVNFGVLDMLCDPDKIWNEKISTLTMLNADPGRIAWNPSFEGNSAEDLIISWLLDDETSNSALSKKSTRLADASKFSEQAKQLDNAQLKNQWGQVKKEFKEGRADLHKTVEHLVNKMRHRVPYDILSGLVMENTKPSNLPGEKGTDAPYSAAAADTMNLETNGAVTNNISMLINGVLGNITEDQFNDNGYFLLSLLIDDDAHFDIDMRDGSLVEDVSKKSIFRQCGLEYIKEQPLTTQQLDAIIEKYPQVLTVFCEQVPQVSPVGDARTKWARRRDLKDTITRAIREQEDGAKAAEAALKNEWMFSWLSDSEGRRFVLSLLDLSDAANLTQADVLHQLYEIRDGLYSMLLDLQDAYDKSVAFTDSKSAFTNKVNEILHHFGVKSVEALQLSRSIKEVFDQANSQYETQGRLSGFIKLRQQEFLVSGFISNLRQQLDPLIKDIKAELNDKQGKALDKALDKTNVKDIVGSFEDKWKELGEKAAETMLTRQYNALANGQYISLLALKEAAKRGVRIDEPRPGISKDFEDAIKIQRDQFEEELNDIIEDVRPTGPDELIDTLEFMKSEALARFDEVVSERNETIPIYEKIDKDGLSHLELSQKFVDGLIKNGMRLDNLMDVLPHVLQQQWIGELAANPSSIRDSFVANVVEHCTWIHNTWNTDEKPPTVEYLEGLIDAIENKTDEADAAFDTLEELFRNWNLLNGRNGLAYASVPNHFDPTLNPDAGNTVSNVVDNLSAIGKLLTDAVEGNNDLSEHLRKRIGQSRTNDSGKRSEWKKLKISLDADSVWTASRASFQAGTGSIPSGVAADNMLNRFMLPVYLLDGDTVCDTPGKERMLGDINYDQMLNGRLWYSETNDPKSAKLLNDRRWKELSKKGATKIYVWDVDEHSRSCTCPGCKLQAPAPTGSTAPNYGPLKDLFRRFINACEPNWLKLKKSMDKAKALDYSVSARPELVEVQKWRLQASANYKGSINGDLHTFVQQETDPSSTAGYRFKYREILTDMFLNDENYSGMEFGETEANLLTNFLTNYVNIETNDKIVATVSLDQLKAWDTEIQASKGQRTFVDILAEKIKTDPNNIKNKSINLSFKPVSVHSMMQIAAQHSLEQAAKHDLLGKDQPTQEQYSQWVQEAWALDNGAKFKTASFDDLMAGYGTRTKYLGTQRKFGWGVSSTQAVREIVSDGLDYRRTPYNTDFNKVSAYNEKNDKHKYWPRARSAAQRLFGLTPFKSSYKGSSDISLGHVFRKSSGKQVDTLKPTPDEVPNVLDFNEGKQIQPSSDVEPEVFGDDMVLNVCADKSLTGNSIKWLVGMQNRMGYDKRFLVMPKAWYDEYQDGKGWNEEDLVQEIDTMTWNGYTMVVLAPRNSYVEFVRRYNGYVPVVQADQANIGRMLVVANDDVPDGGMMLFDAPSVGELVLADSGTRKIPVDEWNNGPNGQTAARLLTKTEVSKHFKKLSSGDTGVLQYLGFDFKIAEKQFGISKKDQAAAIATFAKRITDKGCQKDSDHLEGVMSKGDCVGILVTKDINGRERYQPVFIDGSLPEMSNIANAKISDDGRNVEVEWSYRRSFKDAIASGYSQKIYFHPAFKAEATMAPSHVSGRYRIAASDWLDGVISHEAFDSRAKEKEQELFARNMYYNWLKEDHGSVFLTFDESGNCSWSKDLSIDLIDVNGQPTELLRQLLTGDDKAWLKVASGDVKLLNENAGLWAEDANWAIRGLVNDCLHNATRIDPMMVLSDTTITIEQGNPIRGMQWNADFGPRTTDLFYFNGVTKLQLAFFHALNPKMCAATLEEEAAAVAATKGDNPETPKFKYTHDNKMLVRDPSTSKTHKTLYWCTYVTDHIRVGQENTEILGTGTEGNIGPQQQLKYAADGFYLTDELVQYNMLFANAMGQGNPEYVLTHQRKHARTNMVAKAVKGPKNRQDVRIISNKFKAMDEQMPSWAYAKGKHAEALNEIGRSFAQSPANILDEDGNKINYVDDPEVTVAVRNFSKKLTGSETGINAFEAINWFYKFYIGYTSSGRADIDFFKRDLCDGLNEMANNLNDGEYLPIKGGISRTFANEKLGERVTMPILPRFLTERIFKMNPQVKAKYKTVRAWQKAQLEEYMESRDEILAITDTAKRTNLSKFAEWIGLTTHLDTQMHAFGDLYVAQEYNELNQQLLETLNYISPVSVERTKKLAEATQKRIEDSRAVRRSGHTSQHLDADGNPTVAVEEGVTKEQAYKFVRGASAVNKFMRLLNPLITAGALAERGTYTTMTRFALFASNKLGIGPYRTTADFDFDGRFALAKEVSKDKNSLALFAAIRENEVNGDFSWNYEEFSNIEQFMGALKKIEKNKNVVERWQRKLTDIMAGKGVFAKGQIENFWNFFCSYGMEHAARGEEEWVNLFAKTEPGGKSIFQSELENGGAARLMARVLSPQSPYRGVAIVALNHSKRCDMAQRSAVGMIYSELVKDKPLAELVITSGFCPFVNYTINTTERVLNFIAPMSSLRYIFINLISQYNGKVPGRDITWDQLHLEDAQLTDSLREALALDAAKMGSAALAALLISLSGAVEPPEDDDKWQNTEEWTIFGLRIQENWWLSDLLGPAMAMVCFARSWELGQPRFDILTSKLGDCLYSNPALKAGGLIGDMLDPWSAMADAAETDNDIYGKTKQGDVTFAEMVGSDATVYAMNYLCQFITPSVLKEIYRDSQTYAVSYKKVYKTDEYGQIVYNEDGTAAVEYTNYLDAKIRKLARQNPVWALLCDLATGNGASTTGTGYLASEMPEIVIYDPEQIASYKTFSLYNEDGTEKDDNEKEAVALAVISLLQGNDIDELKAEGFAVPYDTLKYTGDVVKSIINKNSDIYKQFVDEGGMDYYKQGDGDYNLGKEQVEKIKAAYDNDTRYWKDFYYNVLWSDEMKQSITKYKQYNTLYDTDRNGNYYATGYARGIAPVLIAQGTTTDPGETTGWGGDWGTASAVTGKTMYDTNGNALRALEPYTEIVETPSLETNGYSSGWQNYNYSGYGRYYSRGRSGWRSYGGGSSRSYARSGGSVYSNAKSAYPNNLSYRSYNAGDLTNLTASRANVYGSNLDYLRPGFTIKGSRQGYKRNDY